MSVHEIPLLRESAAYASRLMDAARAFAQPTYHWHRRVNWSYRLDENFYVREGRLFSAAPDDYLAGRAGAPSRLDDVYLQRLRWKQTLVVLAKVIAHWSFHVLGRFADLRLRAEALPVYRKGYVDDIELVFDVEQPGVVRAIYPFPINVRRQLRYLQLLHRSGRRFKLAGNPYVPGDVWRFVLRRDVRSLVRLECRAQVRHARQVAGLGVRTVQLSDEFDIGSLDFARALARYPVHVVNSAHGVGKYLPMHAYQEFHVLTLKQQAYYRAVRPCRYRLRRLNLKPPTVPSPADSPPIGLAGPTGGIDLVVLSQRFVGTPVLIEENEALLVSGLAQGLAGLSDVRLHYKPHPNRNRPTAPAGFELLTDLHRVNGRAGTVFVSFYSTCQIDPSFVGRKILVRGQLIHPEISFDESEEIVDLLQLIALLRDLATGAVATGAPAPGIATAVVSE